MEVLGFLISTGNKGVDQLVIKFFRKCGISLFLCLIIPFLLITSGCIEKPTQLDVLSSQVPESQATEGRTEGQSTAASPSHLQADFDSEVRSNLFRLKGNLAFTGNSSLSYLLLNATLLQDGRAAASTKYLLIQVEPGEDHGFEISRNMRIPHGSYDCRLEVTGPQGLLCSETRGCHLAVPWDEKSSPSASISPAELERKTARQESQEEKLLREKTENGGDQGESALEGAAKKVKSGGSHDEQPADKPETKPGAANSSDASKNPKSNDEAAAEEMQQDAKANPSSENHGSSSLASPSLDASASRSADKEARLVGSSTSKKYHRPDCRYALKIKPENKITFASIEDAQRQGYLPCKTCSP